MKERVRVRINYDGSYIVTSFNLTYDIQKSILVSIPEIAFYTSNPGVDLNSRTMCIQCADNTYIVFIMLHISLSNTLEPGDEISAVVAAAVHDIHHLGFTNSFFCNASDSFTVLYNDIAC